MVTENNNLWQEIVSFIEDGGWNSTFFGRKLVTLTRETEVEKDLRITGCDADEFMFEFHQKFPFEIGNFNLSDYVANEGLVILPLPFFKKQTIKKPLTLGMLEAAALKKKWEDPLE
jgi:hypothetical protein